MSHGNRCLVGLHPGKTGGTTLHDHAKRNLPDARYVCGIHEDAARLMRGERLLVEYDDHELAQVSFVFGHRLRLEEALLFPHESSVLFTIVRDPFERFVSIYKHYLRTRRDTGSAMTAEAFLETQPDNPLARNVEMSFGRFAEEQGSLSAERLRIILGNLNFILSTERLDDQAPYLCGIIGLPGPEGRSRVYPESPDLGGVTRDRIYARDHLDLFITQCAKAQKDWRKNPFGSDHSGRYRCRTDLVDKTSREYRSKEGFAAAFRYLKAHSMLHALRVSVSVRRDARVAARLATFCEAEGIDLDQDNLLAREKLHIGAILIDLNKSQDATEVLKEVIERDADNFLAHYHLARALTNTKKLAEAEAACRRAIELNDTNRVARSLLQKIREKRGQSSIVVDPLGA